MKNYHYEKYLKKAWGIANRLSSVYQIPADDLIGEANLAYVVCMQNYQPKQGPFSAYFNASARNRMIDFARKQRQDVEYNDAIGYQDERASSFGFLFDLRQSLSEQAQEVVDTILEAPGELLEMADKTPKKKITLGVLRGFFRKQNWQHKAIEAVFAEIREELHAL